LIEGFKCTRIKLKIGIYFVQASKKKKNTI